MGIVNGRSTTGSSERQNPCRGLCRHCPSTRTWHWHRCSTQATSSAQTATSWWNGACPFGTIKRTGIWSLSRLAGCFGAAECMPARYPSFAVTPTLRQPFYASLLAVPITTAAACSGVQTPATTMRMRACGFRVERPVTAPEPQEKHSGLVSASVCRVLGRCARIAARSICATFLASESTLPRVITTRVRLRRCLSPPRMRDRSEIRSAATRLKPNPGLTSPLYQAVRAMPARGGSWRIVWISDKHCRKL